jgi:hypothetical protein
LHAFCRSSRFTLVNLMPNCSTLVCHEREQAVIGLERLRDAAKSVHADTKGAHHRVRQSRSRQTHAQLSNAEWRVSNRERDNYASNGSWLPRRTTAAARQIESRHPDKQMTARKSLSPQMLGRVELGRRATTRGTVVHADELRAVVMVVAVVPETHRLLLSMR